MCVGSPTAGAWSSFQRRPDDEFETDRFGGSGSTLIAAEKTGRRARLCEIDPIYCDRILARWEAYAQDDAARLETEGAAAADGQAVAP